MKVKVKKIYVKKHIQKSGECYFIGYAVFEKKFLWIIPYWVTKHLSSITLDKLRGEYHWFFSTSLAWDPPHNFSTEQEAKERLLLEVEDVLKDIEEKEGKKVVGIETIPLILP